MKKIYGNVEELLNRYICGFHQYILEPPYHIVFVGENLCELLGCDPCDLIHEDHDAYVRFVHPEDRKIYGDFLRKLAKAECTLSLQYRIVKKDGVCCFVNDTFTSKRDKNGLMIGSSVLTDITPLKTENDELRFLNDTVPCGFLKYTCDKQPKITYLNEQMKKIMRFPEVKDGEMDYLEMYKENIYLTIPIEERHRFSRFLEKVYTKGTTISGEMTILRCDGTKAHLYGWVTKCIGADGREEFQSVCMDMTERYRSAKESETERYLKALTDVYDKIFEYDFSNRTVRYLYGHNSETFHLLQNIPMQLEEATQRWIKRSIVDEDREDFKTFISRYLREPRSSEGRPPQIKFRAYSSKGELKCYIGIFLKIDAAVSLFCCRSVAEHDEATSLRNENLSLRNINENMQEIVMRFTEGIAAFEIKGDTVMPLYMSDNVCEFFEFSKEEWQTKMKEATSIEEFVSRSGVDYEEFLELLANGEAEFSYYDIGTDSHRRIKAICSQKGVDADSPRYVMLYNVNEEPKENAGGSVYIRTFGYFDVFVGDKPIAFRNKRSKELFALLVDRRGGYITSEEAIGFLWEDEPISAVTLARYRKVALRLKNILEEYGIADIVESIDGKRRIVTEKVRCDLYDYLSGKEEFIGLFKGSYLTNYSWGENTLAELQNELYNS